MTTVIDTPEGIAFFTLCSQIGAAKLELRGLKHSSGRSVIAHCKRVYGLKGNRVSIVAQLEARREAILAARAAANAAS
jgi:hypothetical protein